MPEYQHRHPRWNARFTSFFKDQVHVVFGRHQNGDRMIIIGSPWGPWLVDLKLQEDPDFHEAVAAYLHAHPPPPPEPIGPSVYERLRRPEL